MLLEVMFRGNSHVRRFVLTELFVCDNFRSRNQAFYIILQGRYMLCQRGATGSYGLVTWIGVARGAYALGVKHVLDVI